MIFKFSGKYFNSKEDAMQAVAVAFPHATPEQLNDRFNDFVQKLSKCPVCGGAPGMWGMGTCSGRCWGDLYGE